MTTDLKCTEIHLEHIKREGNHAEPEFSCSVILQQICCSELPCFCFQHIFYRFGFFALVLVYVQQKNVVKMSFDLKLLHQLVFPLVLRQPHSTNTHFLSRQDQ